MDSKPAGKTRKDKLVFGIYPGGGVETDPETGLVSAHPDQPACIKKALDELQPGHAPFLIRGYIQYVGAGIPAKHTPADMVQYTSAQRKLDLVLCYRAEKPDLDGWTDFIRSTLREYGPYLGKIQITEEPNNPDAKTGGDGSFPGVRQAIIAGVLTAKDEIRKLGLAVQVGFNATPSFDPNDEFWNEIGQMSHSVFLEALDYVGLDFFPDVFRPLPASLSLQEAVTGVITNFRVMNLAQGRIPATIPIHISEHGWPTAENRSEERQAQVIEEVLRTIDQKKEELNITHYEFFDLRDADSSKPGLQFGLLHADYTPKPAFDVFRRLIQELGSY